MVGRNRLRPAKLSVLVLVGVLSLTSCETTTSQDTGAMIGTVVGVVIGAGAGALCQCEEGVAAGIAIGAAGGALIGAAVGRTIEEVENLSNDVDELKAENARLATNQPAVNSSAAPPEPVNPAPKEPAKKRSTGSGIIVSAEGHILTNHHVVNGCRTTYASTSAMVEPTGISVQPRPDAPATLGKMDIFNKRGLEMLGSDARIDLALLKSNKTYPRFAAFRGGRGIRAGDDIVVTGFPYYGLVLSDINVSKGIVSALSGRSDDRRTIQITAPIQPGNSGGPVLDNSGNVVGVVVGKLDAIKIANATGMLPENVNFAISQGAARAFLDTHDVAYQTARSDKTILNRTGFAGGSNS